MALYSYQNPFISNPYLMFLLPLFLICFIPVYFIYYSIYKILTKPQDNRAYRLDNQPVTLFA